MKRIVVCAVMLLMCAGVASAANLGKYEGWDESPLGYFMTKAEREQWKAVASENQAAQFIADFKARRDAKFEADILKRAAMADQHLSFGKVKGSTTLAGKLIVLFGPPIDIKVEDRKGKSRYNSPPPAAAVTNLGVGASSRDAEGDRTQLGSGQPGQSFRDYTFTFSEKNAPGLGRPQYTATVALDLGIGKAALKDTAKQAELESIIESVAAASIKK